MIFVYQHEKTCFFFEQVRVRNRPHINTVIRKYIVRVLQGILFHSSLIHVNLVVVIYLNLRVLVFSLELFLELLCVDLYSKTIISNKRYLTSLPIHTISAWVGMGKQRIFLIWCNVNTMDTILMYFLANLITVPKFPQHQFKITPHKHIHVIRWGQELQ